MRKIIPSLIGPLFFTFVFVLAPSGVEGQIPSTGHPDFNGTWEVKWENPANQVWTMVLTIEETDGKLEGTARIQEPASERTEDVPIFDAGIDGTNFMFKVAPGNRTSEDPMMFYGVAGLDVMGGYMVGSRNLPSHEIPFEAERR